MRRMSIALIALMSACAVSPEGEEEERERAAKAYPDVELPELAPSASTSEILRRAFLANGDLRRRWWEWKAALEAVPQAGSVKTNVGFTFEQMFDGSSTSRKMTTLGLQTDPMAGLPWPGKLSADARIALEEARAAGHRFDGARLELEAKTRQAWIDYALAAELGRLQESNVALARSILESMEARVSAGKAPQQDVLKARNAVDLAENGRRTQESRLPARRAALNALLAREPGAALDVPAALPAARPLLHDDATLLQLAAERHPELKALAREAKGRADAVDRARLEWIPELSGGFTFDLNGMARTVMGMLSAPLLRYEAIRAGVEQAKASLEGARALRRQAELDLKARVVVAISDFRNVERQIALYEGTILPRTEQAVEASRAAYGAGQAPALELLEALRMRVELRGMSAELRAEREKLLAELEALSGIPGG